MTNNEMLDALIKVCEDGPYKFDGGSHAINIHNGELYIYELHWRTRLSPFNISYALANSPMYTERVYNWIINDRMS